MSSNFYESAKQRMDLLESIDLASSTSQLVGFLKFLESYTNVMPLLESLATNKTVEDALKAAKNQMPPQLGTLEEIASACVMLLNLVREKNNVTVVFTFGIRSYADSTYASIPHEFTRRYIRPLYAHIALSLNSSNLLEEFQCRFMTLLSPQFQEATPRIAAYWEWLNATPTTAQIITDTLKESRAQEILAASNYLSPPQTESPEDILAVGLLLMKGCAEGVEIYQMLPKYGIHPMFGGSNLQDTCDTVMQQYIIPAISHIEGQLMLITASQQQANATAPDVAALPVPPEIRASLAALKADHPEPTAFIMMQFAQTETHNKIVAAIKEALAPIGITALRADDHQYHDDVFPNVKTYMHGCAFGIAVFERIENEVFNPNVSLEVGYMLALGKPICYLKDKSLKNLPTDLISKLYREFDTHAVETSLPPPLLKWLEERKPHTPAPVTV